MCAVRSDSPLPTPAGRCLLSPASIILRMSTTILDRGGRERAALFEVVPDWSGRRVLEVGCGDGRLTAKYAAAAGSVLAIDPDPDEIALARIDMPDGLGGRIEWRVAGIENLGSPRAAFDIILLSWAL